MANIAIKHFHPHTQEKKKKSRWKMWLALVLIAICIGGLIYVVNLPQYQIKNVEVKGAVLTDEGKVKGIAEADIAGKYFFIIPKTFIWTYPKARIGNDIGAILSVLDSDIGVGYANILNITLTERAQKYLWCRSDSSGCYYMDEKGLVFTEAPALEGNVFVKFSGLLGAGALGMHFLPEAQMAELLTFINKIKDLGLNAKAVNAVSPSEIRIVIQSGTELIVSLEKPLAAVYQNLKILSGSPDFANASGGIENLKYIDLRYGTKAFWK